MGAPPPGERYRNTTSFLILAHWTHTGSTWRIATPSEKDRAIATSSTHKNLVKIGRVVFELCERTDRLTNKQTDILITILFTPFGSKVKISGNAPVRRGRDICQSVCAPDVFTILCAMMYLLSDGCGLFTVPMIDNVPTLLLYVTYRVLWAVL